VNVLLHHKGSKADGYVGEKKLKDSGRLNWSRENIVADNRMKTTDLADGCYEDETRDERLTFLEDDDMNLKAVLTDGWKAPYAKALKSKYKEKKQRQKGYQMYQGEAKFRESRAKYFAETRGSGVSETELESMMDKWDRENDNDCDSLPMGGHDVQMHRPGFRSSVRLPSEVESEDDMDFEDDDLPMGHQDKALRIYIEAYIAKHSAPSNTTPTGQPRMNHPCSTALYTPRDMLSLPVGLGYKNLECEKYLWTLYSRLQEFDSKSTRHQLAERSLFDFCYILSGKLTALAHQNVKSAEHVSP
jgi:hypothetical protein